MMKKSDLKIFNSFTEPIIILDENMKLLYSNARADEFLKLFFQAEIYLGENISKFAFDFFRDIQSYYQEIADTGNYISREVISLSNGIRYKIQISDLKVNGNDTYLTIINTNEELFNKDIPGWNEIFLNYHYEKSKNGVIIFDDSDGIAYFNKKFIEITNLKYYENHFFSKSLKKNDVLSLMSDSIIGADGFFKFTEPHSKSDYRETEIIFKNNKKYTFSVDSVTNPVTGRSAEVFTLDEKNTIDIALYPLLKKGDSLVFQSADYGILIFDGQFDIQFANKFLCSILKYEPEEIMLQNANDFFRSDIGREDIIPGLDMLNKRSENRKVSITGKDNIKYDFSVNFRKYQKAFILASLTLQGKNVSSESASIQLNGIFYRLAMKLRNFNHNEISLANLNRIGLLIKNLGNVTYSSMELPDIEKSNILFPQAIEKIINLIKEYNFKTQPLLNEILLLLHLVEPELKSLNLFSKINELGKNLEECMNSNAKVFSVITLEQEIVNASDIILNNQNVIMENVNKIKYIIKTVRNLLYTNFKTDVRIIAEEIAEKHKQQDKEIPVSFASENLPSVLMDKDELKDIIDILFNNAYQAMNLSESTEKRININIYESKNKCILQFENQGSKLDDNVKNKLFELGSSSKADDRGFGLYYVKSCLTKFGGDIFYDDSFKKGVRFNLEFKQI